ncbi:hypothetical protein L7F22_066132 [Adiantum nelumboides]|nr:hypothetical protein [Adiantum nelumboides]
MEGLFNERLQVRTRHLEERVGALSKQLATQKDDNARLHRSYADATHKVQVLEEDLKNERERCHKLAISLSASRRNMKNKSSPFEEGEHFYTSEPIKSPRSDPTCFLCGQCLPHADGGTFKTEHKNGSLPKYMGIMPARLNSKLMKSKKTTNFILKNGPITHRDRQLLTRGLNNIDNQSRCVNCCCDVEVLLARILHLYDLAQQDHFIDACKKQDNSQGLLHNNVGGHDYHLSGSLQRPNDTYGKRPLSSNAQVPKNSMKLKPEEQLFCDLRTLSTEGYYVRMETAQSDHQQSCGMDNSAALGIDPIHGSDRDYDELQSLQYVLALKAENKALRGALLSSKKVEIQELESELREIKQTAMCATSLVQDQSTHSSCKRCPTKAEECTTMSNVDGNGRREWSQMDPIKFLDVLHKVDDKILEKKISILGLECGGAALESGVSMRLPADCTDRNYTTSDEAHMKADLNKDLRHVLTAVVRDVPLRQENQWSSCSTT